MPQSSGDSSVQIAHTQGGQLTQEEDLNAGKTPFVPSYTPPKPLALRAPWDPKEAPLSGCPHTNGA